MIVLSHRGFWRSAAEKNGVAAFARTIAAGYGTETDIRDTPGGLVVSHDPPQDGAMAAEELVAMFRGTGLPLAVNVKADGLSAPLARLFEGSDVPWFAFDMSGPETVRYARAGLPFFTRHSDVERVPLLYEAARGVWLDAFDAEWFDGDVIAGHLAAGKDVCVVSSELHGRDAAGLWALLDGFVGRDRLMLCTDTPDRAAARFGR